MLRLDHGSFFGIVGSPAGSTMLCITGDDSEEAMRWATAHRAYWRSSLRCCFALLLAVLLCVRARPVGEWLPCAHVECVFVRASVLCLRVRNTLR